MQAISGMPAVRVLVADDNTDVVEVMQCLFESIGCCVEVANDGQEAVNVAPKLEPELVVMDIDMPVLDGCEAAKTLRQQAWSVGTIFVAYTALTGRQIVERVKKCGFHEYVRKPAPFSRFEALVHRIRQRAGKRRT